MSGGWGAGGVLSSTRDVATFYHAVFDGLLAPASIEAMQTTTPGSGDYGLGIDTEQFTAEAEGWGTAGAIIGYTAAAGITDDGWSVAVLTNHLDVASGGREPSPMDLVAELLLHINTEA
jgi:D-alanyl-D-alanine carboxypeptidase